MSRGFAALAKDQALGVFFIAALVWKQQFGWKILQRYGKKLTDGGRGKNADQTLLGTHTIDTTSSGFELKHSIPQILESRFA